MTETSPSPQPVHFNAQEVKRGATNNKRNSAKMGKDSNLKSTHSESQRGESMTSFKRNIQSVT